MTDIYHISAKIFNKQPQKPNSIQLYLDKGDMNELFEILCIMIGECLNLKLPNLIKYNRNISNFITTLKQYFQSFGFDFNYQIITDPDNHEFRFNNYYDFQVEKLYNFKMVTKFIYHDFLMNYIPGIHNSNNLSDFVLYLKIKQTIYQLNFNYFH